jgi:uncharacterized delta-60 repeat protein
MSKKGCSRLLRPLVSLLTGGLVLGLAQGAEVVPGTLDLSFRPRFSSTVNMARALPDGRVVVGGYFTRVNDVHQPHLARLNADGTLDESFAPAVDGAVDGVWYTPAGKLLISGSFTEINGMERRRLALLNLDGSLEVSFAPEVSKEIKALLLQPDGRIVLTQGSKLVRLNADGTVDPSFNCTFAGSVYALAGLPDGRILLGGAFYRVNGITTAKRLARLNPDGSLDESFTPSVGTGTVQAIAVRDDYSCYVGGSFSSGIGGRPQQVAHFLPNGSMDYSFQVTIQPSTADVLSLRVAPNGKLVVAGDFSGVNGETRHNLVQVNDDGSTDAAFVGMTDATGEIRSVTTTDDGRLLIAGSFDQVDQIAQKYLARLHGEQPSHILQAEIWIAVEIGWNSEAGKHYQVQWADEVDSAFWYDLGEPVEGTGQKMYVFDSVRASGPQKFYRVKVLD